MDQKGSMDMNKSKRLKRIEEYRRLEGHCKNIKKLDKGERRKLSQNIASGISRRDSAKPIILEVEV